MTAVFRRMFLGKPATVPQPTTFVPDYDANRAAFDRMGVTR